MGMNRKRQAEHVSVNQLCHGGVQELSSATRVEAYRVDALQIAEDFCYDKECIKDINRAKTSDQISDALMMARRRKEKYCFYPKANAYA